MTHSKRYWKHKLWLIDLFAWIIFPFDRAFRLALRFKVQQNKYNRSALTYGETPYAVLAHMMSKSKARPGQLFLECGCGYGRLSLLAAQGWRLQAKGIDLIPAFIKAAERICSTLGIEGCGFVCGDMFSQNWENADIVYVTSTTFPLEVRQQLNAKWSELSAGTHVFTLTYPPEGEHLTIISSEVLSFSWGASTLFHAIVL